MPRTMRVRDRMRPGAVTVAWSDSADAALVRMQYAGLDAIPVVNDQQVIGLLERGATCACQRDGNWLGSISVASLMRRGVFVCRANDALEHALATTWIVSRSTSSRSSMRPARLLASLAATERISALHRLVPAFYRSY